MLPKVTGSQICEKHLMERTHPHRNHSQSSPLLWALALVRYWHSIPSIPHVMCTVVNGYEIAFCSNRTPLCAGLPHTEPNFTLKVHLILSPATQYPVSAGVRCSWPRANQRDIVASPWSLCKVNIWKPWSRQSLGLPLSTAYSIHLPLCAVSGVPHTDPSFTLKWPKAESRLSFDNCLFNPSSD